MYKVTIWLRLPDGIGHGIVMNLVDRALRAAGFDPNQLRVEYETEDK